MGACLHNMLNVRSGPPQAVVSGLCFQAAFCAEMLMCIALGLCGMNRLFHQSSVCLLEPVLKRKPSGLIGFAMTWRQKFGHV